ncbi:DUF4097 family beta strand repeat-containing protein [Microbacterium pygmaeum]|uniref:Putative adhesin n=1 Tax=Microbacterium pygmaeum TaxID=370764 RepID=A0A1G7WS51_9MICO|nr:DUF4097 family beta strand repeat-containing protein [Microbacterium pygmaeum]SDG74805.1 Putative adhesin [Microbacterium pygmaeum]
MSTTMMPPGAQTPPPPPVPPMAQPAGGPAGEPPRQTRSASRVIAILTIALGAAIVLGTILTAVFSTVATAAVRTESRSVDASGVRDLDVEVGGSSVRIEFADVTEATLEVTSGRGASDWTLERDGDELNVSSPEDSWFDWRWSWGDDSRATLTLPESLRGPGLDASLGLSAGDLSVDGDFGELEIEIGAGSLTVSGSARTLSADLSAGDADIDLADVEEAQFQVSAGSVDSRLTGDAPRTVVVEVSAGGLDLTLPSGVYDVRSDVSAGEFDNGLSTEMGARNSVDVSVSAGSVTIRSPR